MMTAVDEYLDTPLETDEIFPCQKCGEILEEGKAYELAGRRWHIDCFHCHGCGVALGSDANLLLLGDGSLVCNNCTYTCDVCGNKIDDLAILTNEQAFCKPCFRCRNCKRKIENLRYARTSQGIFCMGCHGTLMVRRRKKSKATSAAKLREKDASPMITEKSLPALPPSASPNHASTSDRPEPDTFSGNDFSPNPRAAAPYSESTSRTTGARPSRSPETDTTSAMPEPLSLPASTYRKNRTSTVYQPAELAAGADTPDSFFISVALDPSPGPHGGTPLSVSEAANAEASTRQDKDYFSIPKSSNPEPRNDAHKTTPHIAFQEKGRQHSSDLENPHRKQATSRKHSRSMDRDQSKPSSSSDDFKLQDAPKLKTDQPIRNDSSRSLFTQLQDSAPASKPGAIPRKDHPPTLSELRRANEAIASARPSHDARWQDEDELSSSRETSMKGTPRPDQGSKTIPRKEMPLRTAKNINAKAVSQTIAPTSDKSIPVTDTYMHPRAAPAPPGPQPQSLRRTTTVNAKGEPVGSPKVSPKLPRWSSGGDFSMDEDMARILGTDETSSSILRRVSNVVRHGRAGSIDSSYSPQRARHARSISETTRGARTDDRNGHPHISSPVLIGSSAEDASRLKRQLRNSEQRIAELERQFTTEKDLQDLHEKLVEKRKTVSVLDTQTEIMIRQLEVLAGYVERAKETKTPVDHRELEDSAIKEFVQKLDKVKQYMSASIEQLHEERNQLVAEKDQAMADRDRALMEFEQLSSKNAQLADMNNDLTHQIQERFKARAGNDNKPSPTPNGLGIYAQGKGASNSAVNLETASMTTGAILVPDEEPIIESGPTVVQVRKGQVKKFNWKKGSKTVAQNVAKGVNRAVVAFHQNDRDRVTPHPGAAVAGMTSDNIGMPYNMTVSQAEPVTTASYNGYAKQQPPQLQQQQQLDPGRQGFGFFGKKNTMPKSTSINAAAAAAAAAVAAVSPVVAELPSVLFGSELADRSEYERRQIPTVVTRCIEEVELRGMDQEGIYRKTGGNSQVNAIKDGFDRRDDFDISDPDLDITAVTSVLKQYFRRLPTPLLTFDVYDQVLESNAIPDAAERCYHLRRTFASMPQSHRACLEFLMFHLARVANRESENLMSPKNLAVIFAPTIMRDLSIEREMTDMHAKNIAVQFVIENSRRIFDDS